ncbi:MerR family transcriptional regulator [Pantoea sp. 3_1284]|uniref:MerR family transcriptional regulator n=1 Tax=Pantoea sp. 3_1284 TaxID=2259618 RepID=UPI000DE3432B|nr:MerR family transcriptional regulator [Pantoea sp. 3_1284]RBO11081.1 hypothetical protein DSL62_19275 [Pantoea sp. 3_1284]
MSESNSKFNKEHNRTRNESHQRTYSLAQIATKLGRPASTVRTWKDQYNEYVESTSIGKGRNKRYTGDAVRIFSLIDEMKERNEPHELIQQTLSENVDHIVYTPDDENGPPALMNEILDSYRNIVEVMKSQEDRIKELESYIKESDEQAKQREIEREQRTTKIIQNLSQQLEKQTAIIEKQQRHIDERLNKRDSDLMVALRASQEAKAQAKEIAEQAAAQVAASKEQRKEIEDIRDLYQKQANKGFFARLFSK